MDYDNEEFQDLVDYIFDLHEKYGKSEARKKKLSESRENRSRYAQETDVRRQNFPFKDAVAITLPLVTIAVDNIEPRMVAALAGSGDEIVRFKDTGEPNPEINDLQDWFNVELIYRVKLPAVVRAIVHGILVDGTLFVIGNYTHKEEIRRDFKYIPTGPDGTALNESQVIQLQLMGTQGQAVPIQYQIAMDEQGNPISEDYIDPYYDGGELQILDLEDMFMPDDAEDWEEADIAREVSIPYNDLRRLAQTGPGWKPIDDELFTESEEEDQLPSADSGKDEQAQVKVHGRREVKCVEAHVKWNFLSKEDRAQGKWAPDEKLIVLCTKHRKQLLRVVKQRDLNFLNNKLIRRLRLFPEHGQSYGTALATKLKQVQDAGTETFNLVLNSAWICVLPWFFYGPESGLETVGGKRNTELELAPGKGIPCADPSKVQFPKFNVNPQQFIEFINMFFSLWERLSSVSDVQVGRAPEVVGKRAQTATATMAQLQEAQLKHSYTGTSLREEFVSIIQLLYDLYYTHMPITKLWEQEGEKKTINKAAMKQRHKFILTGSTENANKYIDRKEAEDLFTLLGSVPIVNLPKLVEDIFRKYGKENPEQYIDPNINVLLKIYLADPQGIMGVIRQYVATREALATAQEGQPKPRTEAA